MKVQSCNFSVTDNGVNPNGSKVKVGQFKKNETSFDLAYYKRLTSQNFLRVFVSSDDQKEGCIKPITSPVIEVVKGIIKIMKNS